MKERDSVDWNSARLLNVMVAALAADVNVLAASAARAIDFVNFIINPELEIKKHPCFQGHGATFRFSRLRLALTVNKALASVYDTLTVIYFETAIALSCFGTEGHGHVNE